MTFESETQLLPVVTLVLWLVCLVVGICGWLLPYARFRPPPKPMEPVQAELIDVKIAPALPQPEIASPQTPPTLGALAEPRAPVSFAIPMKVPSLKSIAAPTTQQLTYGQGEGVQPAPEYPVEAQLAGQHGTVVVRFTVDKDGDVTSAVPITPSPWPLLNQAAVRAVHETWHFSPGPVRSYEVSIQFVLRQSP